MKKIIITLIATLGLAVGTTAIAVAANTPATAKLAARPTMTGALSASSGFPTKCPPATPVGNALGLKLTKLTVTGEPGDALICSYSAPTLPGRMFSPTIEWRDWTLSEFLSIEGSVIKHAHAINLNNPKNGVTGVTAYWVPFTSVKAMVLEDPLFVWKGGVACLIGAWFSSITAVGTHVTYHPESLAHLKALASVFLKKYW